MAADPDLGIAGLSDAVLVGRGGFGEVYRARESRLNRWVAVKILATVLDDQARERFEREGYAMGTVAGHPNIVQVLASGSTATGRPYLLMPFVASGSLDQVPPLPWQQAASYAVRLCGALATAHAAGVLHRDIKPANILVSDFGEPLLADFGIARVSGGYQTASGVVTASVAFSAPEILGGAPASEPADIYSMGATVYALITGASPFPAGPGEELVSLYRRISSDPPPDLRPLGVPDAVCAVLERSLAKDPRARHESAADLGRALQEAQRVCGVEVTPMALLSPETAPSPEASPAVSQDAETVPVPGTPQLPALAGERGRRRAPVVAAAAVVLAVAAGVLLWPDGEEPKERVPSSSPSTTSSTTPSTTPAVSTLDEFSKPTGLTLAPDGQLYVADEEGHRVVRISAAGEATVFAGTGTMGDGGDGDPAVDATLSFPSDVAVASTGEAYVVSAGRIRVVGKDGIIQRILEAPEAGVRRLVLGTDDTLYAASKEAVWRREPSGAFTRVVAPGELDQVGDIAVDPAGALVVSDPALHRILRVEDGRLVRIAGLGTEVSTPLVDGFPAKESAILSPVGLTYDAEGRLYWSEYGNNRVRMVGEDGKVRTLAGNPEGYSDAGDSGDDGPGRDAVLSLGDGPLAVDADGTVYIGDVGNDRVRRLDADGTIHAFG